MVLHSWGIRPGIITFMTPIIRSNLSGVHVYSIVCSLVGDGPAPDPRGGAPHHLAVVTRLVAELVAAHTRHGEGVNFVKPRVNGFPPVGPNVASVVGLIKVLSNFKSLHSSAVGTVVSESEKYIINLIINII